MDSTIKADLYRYGGIDKIYKGKKIPGFKFTYYFRKASNTKRNSLKGIYYRYILRKLMYKYGFQIPVNTKIGKGFYIGHFGNIIISSQTKIGENCNIGPLTTIGKANRGKLKGFPEIGNKVWIGTGSVIVGNIKIGNDVLIAPNAFVNFDFPDNSLVIGNPGKIIEKLNPTNGYINYIP